jgi:hypothetical protein
MASDLKNAMALECDHGGDTLTNAIMNMDSNADSIMGNKRMAKLTTTDQALELWRAPGMA